MKAKITIKQTFQIEIDGKFVTGDYQIDSDWEGMVKLKCSGPCGDLIIYPPEKTGHVYDLVPRMLGGNAENGATISFEAEVVRANCGHVGAAKTKEFKNPKYAQPEGKQ